MNLNNIVLCIHEKFHSKYLVCNCKQKTYVERKKNHTRHARFFGKQQKLKLIGTGFKADLVIVIVMHITQSGILKRWTRSLAF